MVYTINSIGIKWEGKIGQLISINLFVVCYTPIKSLFHIMIGLNLAFNLIIQKRRGSIHITPTPHFIPHQGRNCYVLQ